MFDSLIVDIRSNLEKQSQEKDMLNGSNSENSFDTDSKQQSFGADKSQKAASSKNIEQMS